MIELSSRYKISALALAFFLHAMVFAVFVWNSSLSHVGVAKDIGSGGIEISLASLAEKPKPATKNKTIKKLIEKKDGLAVFSEKPSENPSENPSEEPSEEPSEKPKEQPVEALSEVEEPLPETEDSAGGGVPLTQKNYISTVLRTLEQNKKYPYIAQRRNQEGTAVLYFEINSQGDVVQFYIKESSGHALLDQEVLAMIERSKPFPAMPKDMTKDNLVLVLPVQFYLR